MTDKEKLEKIKCLADDMYYKMSHLTSDTRPIRKAMEDYRSFIVHEYNKDEQVDKPIDFKQELYKAFGQVRDFTLGMQIAKRFYEMGKQHQEPVSIWHDASEKPNIKEKSGIFVITLLNGEYIGSRYYNYDDITINFGNYDKWAYLNDLVNLPNVERIGKDWKEEPVSENLEEEIDNYVKGNGYDGLDSIEEVKYIANHFAKWQKEHIWKIADGKDLPEIDREVVAFQEAFPTDVDVPSLLKVVIAHRPNPKGYDGKSIATGKVEHYTSKTYDKGGWNIPDVKYWLDVEFPKEIEL